ncbi:hypothetical protein R3W88_003036 [Solanum pinnatisectum]|uniref:RING-type domain-containing protein n=1 Tax=Solanum pinnatisectum TaxID=50273 RepID=A0AAV9MQQ0_9SOLN|nr:hypothetical protein R3W88_003036 [Solanum pinnatisectum]
MISFMHGSSHISTITIIFCTCVYIPFLQLKHTVRTIAKFIRVHLYLQPCKDDLLEDSGCKVNLPASRFLDLDMSSSCNGYIDETCSICLVEFDKEHVVCQLPRCNHVFHMECIEKWLERCQFTCPLCRSLLIHRTTPSPCK